jgi:hypothetical protein
MMAQGPKTGGQMNATEDDIRRLLRSFGIEADATIQAHVKSMEKDVPLRLRLVIEDLTDYGGTAPDRPPRLLEVEGEIRH